MFSRVTNRILSLLIVLFTGVGCSQGQPPEETRLVYPPLPVELELVVHPRLESHLAGVLRDFNREHPQIYVRTKTLHTLAEYEALERFDLFYGLQSEAREWHEQGALLDLSPMQTPEWDPLISELIQHAAHVNGQRIWLPLFLDPMVLHLRTFNFDMSGVGLPSADWTYAEFEAVLRAVADAGYRSAISAFVLYQPVLRAFGGSDYDAASGRWHFQTPENEQALEYLSRLVRYRLVDVDLASTAIHPSISLMAGSHRPSSGTIALPMPSGPAGRFAHVQAYGLMISSDTPHPEAALTFARYLLTPRAQRELAAAGVRPVIADREATVSWRTRVGQETASLVDQSLSGALWPAPMDYDTQAFELIQAMLKGEAPIRETLAMLDELLN